MNSSPFQKSGAPSGLRRRRVFGFTLTEMAIVAGIIGAVTAGVWGAYATVSSNRKVAQAGDEIRYIVTKVQSLAVTNPGVFSSVVSDPGCRVTYKVCPSSYCAPIVPITPPFTGCPAAPPCGAQCTDPSVGCVSGLQTPYSSGTESVSADLAQAGVFPSEMVGGTTATPIYSSPWGQGVTLSVTATSLNECSLASYAGLVAAAQASMTAAALATGTTQTVLLNASNAGASYAYSGTFSLTLPNMPVAACSKLVVAYGNEWIGMGLTSLRVGSYGANNPTSASINLTNANGWCKGPGSASVSLALTFPIQVMR